MIFGPIIGYASQYHIMRNSQSLGNFSIDICAIVLISNILRVMFWYGVGFDVILLYQSLIMIITQVYL